MVALQWVSAAVYGVLVLVAADLWRRDRSVASSWLAAAFACIGAVAVVVALPTAWQAVVPTRTVVAALLLSPWLLYRFAHAFAPPPGGRPLNLFVTGLAVICVGFALFGPALPTDGESSPAWLTAYTVVASVYWVTALAHGARALFVAGRGQRGVIRRRLDRLGCGYAALALALLAQVVGSDTSDLAAWLAAALGIVAGALFLEGFAPGTSLRRRWRAGAEAELDRVTVDLMTATTQLDVTGRLLPAAAQLACADGVRLVGSDGVLIDEIGVARPGASDAPTLEVGLHHGRLLLSVSPWSPLFGEDEARLLRRLGTIADLALDRVAMLERERQARHAAELATRDRDALLAAVAHDMKGPLTAIHGFAELLLGPLAGDVSGRARKFVGRIADNSDFVARLAGDLVDLGAAGAAGGRPERVVIERLVHDLAEPLAFTHPMASVEIGSLPVVSMDRTRARQVFDNLISNALRYAGRHDVRISFSARVRDDGDVEVDVCDDGVGIAPDDAERVFEMFERVGSHGDGTGLGMAITRRIMEGLGGSIGIVPSDTGACFRLRFPAAVIAGMPSPLVAGTNPPPATPPTSLPDSDRGAPAWTSGSGS